MPQMSPIYWLFMMMYFMMMLLLTMMLIFFFIDMKFSKKLISMKENNLVYWMW